MGQHSGSLLGGQGRIHSGSHGQLEHIATQAEAPMGRGSTGRIPVILGKLCTNGVRTTPGVLVSMSNMTLAMSKVLDLLNVLRTSHSGDSLTERKGMIT